MPEVGFLSSQGQSCNYYYSHVGSQTDGLHRGKKIECDSPDSTQDGSRVVPDCAPMEARLNASALSDLNSLQPCVTIVSHNIPEFPALVDLGSTHCFVDPSFAKINSLSTYTVPPITLHLFEGTTTTMITEATDLSIHFTSGDVTPLDSDCKIVLGHNWLTQFNLLIDWVLGSIEFRTPSQRVPAPSSLPDPSAPSPSTQRLDPLSISPSPTDLPKAPGLRAPQIALINAIAYAHACKLEGSIQFSLQLSPMASSSLCAASPAANPDLSAVPKDYHEFADVFSKAKALVLAPH